MRALPQDKAKIACRMIAPTEIQNTHLQHASRHANQLCCRSFGIPNNREELGKKRCKLGIN